MKGTKEKAKGHEQSSATFLRVLHDLRVRSWFAAFARAKSFQI